MTESETEIRNASGKRVVVVALAMSAPLPAFFLWPAQTNALVLLYTWTLLHLMWFGREVRKALRELQPPSAFFLLRFGTLLGGLWAIAKGMQAAKLSLVVAPALAYGAFVVAAVFWPAADRQGPRTAGNERHDGVESSVDDTEIDGL